jgi:hypothetical protein
MLTTPTLCWRGVACGLACSGSPRAEEDSMARAVIRVTEINHSGFFLILFAKPFIRR